MSLCFCIKGVRILSDIIIPASIDISKGTHHLLDSQYVESLKEYVYDREKSRYDYVKLNNLAMIYLYVHRRKNAFEEKKEKTKKEYLSELIRFFEDVRDTVGDFRNLDRRLMEKYENELIKRYPKRTTVARKLVIIKSFLKWLYKVNYLDKDVTVDMSGATVRIKDRPDRNLRTDEVQKVIRHYQNNPKVLALVATLATTGLRIAELASAVWGDLEWDEEVKGYFLTITGKGDKVRDAYIQENVLEVLKEYRRRVGLSDQLNPTDQSPFYPNRHGGFYNSNALSEQLNKYLEAAGVRTKDRRITAHWFRHYFSRQADMAGASITDIQRTLGHESIITTQGYLDRSTSRRLNVGKHVKLNLYQGDNKT